jgi:tetratricopeptide (TPR) repeat protein
VRFPSTFGALVCWGAIRYQQGRYAEAFHLLTEALKQNEKSASALSNLGTVLNKLGRCEEAVGELRQGNWRSSLTGVEALNNRGNALRGLGRLEEAVTSFDRALAIKPAHVEVLANRGSALKDLGALQRP